MLIHKVNEVKSKYFKGEITYNEAKEALKETVNKMNEKGETIAKKHGRKHKRITFTALMR